MHTSLFFVGLSFSFLLSLLFFSFFSFLSSPFFLFLSFLSFIKKKHLATLGVFIFSEPKNWLFFLFLPSLSLKTKGVSRDTAKMKRGLEKNAKTSPRKVAKTAPHGIASRVIKGLAKEVHAEL